MDLKKLHLETWLLSWGWWGREMFKKIPRAGTDIRLKGGELEARRLVVEVSRRVSEMLMALFQAGFALTAPPRLGKLRRPPKALLLFLPGFFQTWVSCWATPSPPFIVGYGAFCLHLCSWSCFWVPCFICIRRPSPTWPGTQALWASLPRPQNPLWSGDKTFQSTLASRTQSSYSLMPWGFGYLVSCLGLSPSPTLCSLPLRRTWVF